MAERSRRTSRGRVPDRREAGPSGLRRRRSDRPRVHEDGDPRRGTAGGRGQGVKVQEVRTVQEATVVAVLE